MKVVVSLLLIALLFAIPTGTGAEEPQSQAAGDPEEQQPDAPEEFIPSEDLPADSAISFPVDI